MSDISIWENYLPLPLALEYVLRATAEYPPVVLAYASASDLVENPLKTAPENPLT